MNNNIEEDYCSFEVSKLLKQKGFNVRSEYSWTETRGYTIQDRRNGDDIVFDPTPPTLRDSTLGIDILGPHIQHCYGPTHSTAIKWLRENFNTLVTIAPFTMGGLDSNLDEDDIKYNTLWCYFIHQGSKFIEDGVNFSIYSKATEAALFSTLQK